MKNRVWMTKYPFLFALTAGALAACGGVPDAAEADEQIETTQSEIINGTLVTTAEAEREGLANVNYPPDMPKSGSGIVVNRRYLVTAAHVVNFASHPSQHEVIMGNQRSRLSRIWLDSGVDLAVAQLDPPLNVGNSATYERRLSTRAVTLGDRILMNGSSHNCGALTETRPTRYAWLPVTTAGGQGYRVAQTFGNPVDSHCETGNVRICSFGDSGGGNLLYLGGVAHLAGITSTGSHGTQNGYFDSCGSVDVFARSSFIKPLVANKRVIYFAPSWNIPYDNNTSAWKTFNPCDNACFTLDYKYDFEQNRDSGHVQVMPANTLTVHTGSGIVRKQMCGNVTFAVFSDGAVQKRGFYDVKATCN
jgi:hypothetical protein